MRKGTIKRVTKETSIQVDLDIDGTGSSVIESPIGFLTHMLGSFAKHGLFDLKMRIKGDIDVDQHHTVEDCGIALGQAFSKALGEKRGISRTGYFVYPMDDALAVVAVDLGGRPYLQYDVRFLANFCGGLDTGLIEDFFGGFSSSLMANVVVRMPYGRSDHHKIEAIFKAFAKAMKMACSIEPRARGCIPSTKGVIENDSYN